MSQGDRQMAAAIWSTARKNRIARIPCQTLVYSIVTNRRQAVSRTPPTMTMQTSFAAPPEPIVTIFPAKQGRTMKICSHRKAKMRKNIFYIWDRRPFRLFVLTTLRWLPAPVKSLNTFTQEENSDERTPSN
jgi:hypothetical protein